MGNYFRPDKEISVLLFFHILLQKMKKQVGDVVEKAGCLFLGIVVEIVRCFVV